MHNAVNIDAGISISLCFLINFGRFVKVNASNIIKEVISSALIFPGINKITQLNKIKKLVKKRVLIEAEKLKDGGK